MSSTAPDLSRQIHVRVSKELVTQIEERASEEGVRRATWLRDAVLGAMSASSLPAMALDAAGGTRNVLLCLRLRSEDYKRFEANAKKRQETTSDFFRVAIDAGLRPKKRRAS
jgi:predicted DNA-binding protein